MYPRVHTENGGVVSLSGEAGKEFSLPGNDLRTFPRKVLASACATLGGILMLPSPVPQTRDTGITCERETDVDESGSPTRYTHLLSDVLL